MGKMSPGSPQSILLSRGCCSASDGAGEGLLSTTLTVSTSPGKIPDIIQGSFGFESGGKTFRIDRNFDKQNKKAELVCEDDGENLSIENGDLELLLGGMDLSGYDNTISVGQLKTRPISLWRQRLKNMPPAAAPPVTETSGPSRQSSVWRNKKRR